MATSAPYWNKTAERYANSPISDQKTYQRKLSKTQEFLAPHMRIAEFGSGTGMTAIAHATHVSHIDATDISENMIQIGKDRAEEAGINNITFSVGTLADLAAADDSPDAVLGLNVIHLIKDRAALLSEVARVLKPGGVFVNSTVCLGKSPLRFIKVLLFGLMPDLFVLSEEQLTNEVTAQGFKIERQWHHAKGGIAVFMVARKL